MKTCWIVLFKTNLSSEHLFIPSLSSKTLSKYFSIAGFNSGGTFTGNNSNIVIDPSTGEVDLSLSFPGTYTITYTFAQDLTNCINSGTSQFELVINAAEIPTICRGATSMKSTRCTDVKRNC